MKVRGWPRLPPLVCANVERKDRIKTLGKRAPDGTYEIPIVGDIGFFGVDGADLIRELMAVKPKAVRFLIYSPGGAVYDAIAVVGYMLEQGIESYTEVYGLCASAATVFAAHSGPKNTAIAPGSLFLVHTPYGSDQKAVDNATAFLVDLYTKAYGWTKAEAKKHMEAEDGEGILWTASEAKQNGVVGEIMQGMKVAARLNINAAAMSEEKKEGTKITAKVKLSTMEAIRAAVGEGATVEVEVDEAVAATLAEKEARIAELSKELNALKAAQGDAATATASAEAAKAEAVQAKADLAKATEANTKAIDALKADHAKAIADLKKPLASATVPDNTEPKADPKTVDPAVKAVASMLKGMSPMDRAKMEVAARRREKATAK